MTYNTTYEDATLQNNNIDTAYSTTATANTTTATNQEVTMRDTSITTPELSPNNSVNGEDTFVNIDSDSVDSSKPDGSLMEVVNQVSSGNTLTTVTDVIKQMKTELLDDHAAWGPEKKMMSLELLLNGADAESDDLIEKDISPLMSPPSDESRSSQSDGERAVPVDCETITPPSTPYSAQTARPPCAICRSENGRCHASDPVSMQTFFGSSLSFEGILSSADWLCMKCYSKWYNRCKRKASSVNAVNDTQAVPNGTIISSAATTPNPPRRKRVREPKDKDKRKARKGRKEIQPIVEVQPEPEPELLDHDTDSDDALLLTRMTYSNYHGVHGLSNSYNGTRTEPPIRSSICTGRDLEMEVDELHTELHRMRGEMMRLAQELCRRDEQMEGMLKFVKTEMAAMHGLLTDIADMRGKSGMPPATTNGAHHPVQMVPGPGTNGHVFHLNGKVLDNSSASSSASTTVPSVPAAENGTHNNSCMVPRLNHTLVNIKPTVL